LFHKPHKTFHLKPHVLKFERPALSRNVTTIKKDRKVVRIEVRKPLLRNHRKPSFPIWEDKTTINPRPYGRIMRERQVKEPPMRRRSMSPDQRKNKRSLS
jgi:hypothetical protein